MYVIFPADEVVYLSYGRLIVVPANSTPESSNSPIRTNSLPPEPSARNLAAATNGTSALPSTSSAIEGKVADNQPSTSKGQASEVLQVVKPKKKLLKLNFNLLRRTSSSKTDAPLTALSSSSSRVRRSVGHRDQSGLATPPSEAFQRFCNINRQSNNNHPPPVPEQKKYSKEKTPSDQGLYPLQEKFSSKRSSSSSTKTSKPSLLQEDQGSKKSSKRSSSSSRSIKQSPLPNNTGALERSQSQIQRETRKEPSRKISTPNSLTADAFYPLSTSREKNLVEPSPEPVVRNRSSSFRLSLRRSKTPECQPSRPDRKKDKKVPKSKPLDRKLSFSDYLTVSREKSSDGRVGPSVSSDRDIVREKSPVLSLFRKTPSPKNLGRDRTPHLSRDRTPYVSRDSILCSHESQIEENSRPPSTGQKHSSGEGSIMRVAIFTY
ncbi:uncharacterized protein DDB_G0280579-like [Euwallacea similis]|uniref:uncharacterized protein DDB_G0280579-like n=1 Tax=Euwallacea similis TaxID=1736056 RepID=UPI00344FFE43